MEMSCFIWTYHYRIVCIDAIRFIVCLLAFMKSVKVLETQAVQFYEF